MCQEARLNYFRIKIMKSNKTLNEKVHELWHVDIKKVSSLEIFLKKFNLLIEWNPHGALHATNMCQNILLFKLHTIMSLN